jgi:hypothetical protein
MSLNNLTNGSLREEIMEDIKCVKKLSEFIRELDPANLSLTLSDLPVDEYDNEAAQIWAFSKLDINDCIDMRFVITSVFRDSFYPLEVNVDAAKIYDFILTMKGV